MNNGIQLRSIPEKLEIKGKMDRHIVEMQKAGNVDVSVAEFNGLYYNLKDKGVSYQVNLDVVNDPEANVFGYDDIEVYWKKR